MENSHFGITDYAVLGVVLTASAAIGLYYRLTGGKQQTIEEYLMADKKMTVFPVACSLMASLLSSVFMLGMPREIYVYGAQILMMPICGWLLGTFVNAYLILPVFFKLQATSVYEYLEIRFGKIIRQIASGSFILQMVLYMSVVLYAPAVALSAVTGISKVASVLSVGLVCTFYSTIGGMKAVLWTDVLQASLMFGGLLAIIIKGAIDSNGLAPIWETAAAGGRINLFDFNPDPTMLYTFWGTVVGGFVTYLLSNGINQTLVQRTLTVKSLQQSQLAVFISWFLCNLIFIIMTFAGLTIYAKYFNCDPVLSKRISKSDQLVPLFVMDSLTYAPGLAGLVVSGIFSGSLSTVSSTVNSLAAVTIEDFVRPILKQSWQTTSTLVFLTKFIACTFGLASMALAFAADRLGGLVIAASMFYTGVGGPMLGIFCLGIFCPRSTQRGAVIGYLIGLVFSFWVVIGANIEKPYFRGLSISTNGCQAMTNRTVSLPSNISFTISTELLFSDTSSPASTDPTSTPVFQEDPRVRNEHIFYLYRLSWFWYAPATCLLVVLTGFIASLAEKRRPVHPDLLSPIFRYWFKGTYTTEANVKTSADKGPEINGENKYCFVSATSQL